MNLFTFRNDKTITLTVNADTVPGLIGSEGTTDTHGNDVYVATDTTLSAADRINDEAGVDVMMYGQSGDPGADVFTGAFQMSGVESLRATNDSNLRAVTFDLSGTSDLERVASVNSSQAVTFNQLTTLADVEVESATTNAALTVQYQNTLLTGDDDTVNLHLNATNRTNSVVGDITLGDVNTGNTGIENLAINVAGADTTVQRINSEVTNVTVSGDDAGSALTVTNYFEEPLRSFDAENFAGDLNVRIGNGTAETDALTALMGTGDDQLTVDGGRLAANLGAGDDTLIIDTLNNRTNNHGLRADDAINGADGVDTLQLGWFSANADPALDVYNWAIADPTRDGNFVLSTTEFNNKESIEVIDVRAANTNITLSQAFVASADQTLNITSDMVNNGLTGRPLQQANIAEQRMITTLDTTALSQNTPLVYAGGDGSDRIVLNDATFNSAIDLDGGANFNVDAVAGNGDYDTLTVAGGSTQTVIDAADLGSVRNFEGMNLVKQGGTTTINLVLTQAFLTANTLANDDAANTRIDDRVFQIFSAASQNGSRLGAGDTVNIEIGDFLGVNPAGRGFDFRELQNSGATVVFTNNGVAATAAQIANITTEDLSPFGQADVIASRANATQLQGNTLLFTGTSGNTTSGFEIQGGLMATNLNDTIQIEGRTLVAGAVVNGSAGIDTLVVQDLAQISNAAVANVQNLTFDATGVTGTLDFQLTAAQHNGFTGTITAAGTGLNGESLTIIGDGNFTTFSNVENYIVLDDSTDTRTVTISSLDTSVSAVSASDAVTFVVPTGVFTGTLIGEGTTDDILSVSGTTDVTGATLNNIEALTLANNTALTTTAAQFASFTGTITGAGTETVTLSTAAAGQAIGAAQSAINTITLGSANADTVTVTTGAAGEYAGTLSLAGGGADVVTIVNAVTATGVGVNFNITNFALDDIMNVNVGATDVSNGVFYDNYTGAAALGNIATGQVVEIDANTFTIGTFTNEAAVLAGLAALANPVVGAGGAESTIIVYDGGGQAGIYTALENTGAGSAFDELELVAVVNAADNALVGANFA